MKQTPKLVIINISKTERIVSFFFPPPAISSQVRPQRIQFMYVLLAPVFTDKQLHT
jgi:hypothetical protein